MNTFVSWATGHKIDNAAEQAARILANSDRFGARQLLLSWRQQMETDNLASATVAARMSALCRCIGALHNAGLIEWTVAGVSPRVEQRHDRSGPKRHEVETLTESVQADTSIAGLRDHAIVRLLHDYALRVSEVTGLRSCDVQLDRDGGPVVMALRKGMRERQAVLIGHKAGLEPQQRQAQTMELFAERDRAFTYGRAPGKY